MNFNRLFIYLFLFFAFQNTHVKAQTSPDKTIPGARTWGELVGDLNCTLQLDYDDNPFTIQRAGTSPLEVTTFATPMVGDVIPGGLPEILILARPNNRASYGWPSAWNEWNWVEEAVDKSRLTTYITRNINVYQYQTGAPGQLVKVSEVKTPDLHFEGPNPFLIAKVPGYPNPLVIVATSTHQYSAGFAGKFESKIIAYEVGNTDADDYVWMSSVQYGGNVPIGSLGIKYKSGGAPGIADFNGDGVPEVYIYNEVFNAATGAKLFDGGAFGQGILSTSLGGGSMRGGSIGVSVAADVVPGGNLELVAGNSVYQFDASWNATRIDANFNVNGRIAPDGFTSIADINKDGILDIIVTTQRTDDPNSRLVYVWTAGSGTGQLIAWESIPDPGTAEDEVIRATSLAFIGDIDGNGDPEIGVVSPLRLNMYWYDGTIKLKTKWTNPLVTTDRSGYTLITMFDFNQDGIQELVYRDEENLRIIDGSGLVPTVKAIMPVKAATAGEGAIVADIDGDNEAEIIVTDQVGVQCCNSGYAFTPDASLVVFKSNGFPWAPARTVWNQYAYFSFNVNEDLSIPKPQLNHAGAPDVFFPRYDPASGCLEGVATPFNSFLVQRTLYTEGGCFSSGIPIMDAKVELLSAKFLCLNAGSNEIEVELKISNLGDADLPAEVKIEFTLGTTKIANLPVEQTVPPGGSFTKTIIINSGALGDNPVLPLFAVINPPVNGVYDFPECTYDGPVEIAVIPRPVFMVDQPEAICELDPTGIFIKVTNSTDGSVDNAVVKWYKDAPNGTPITTGSTIGGAIYTIDPDFSLQIDMLPAAITPYEFYLVDECSNAPAIKVLVRVDATPVIDFVEEDVKCFGGNTGFIKEILGDQPYITYRLEGETNFITGPELKARFFSAGTYNVTAKASLNPPAACLEDFQFTIGEPDLFEFSDPGQTEPLCAPTTGAISWNIQGGNPTTTFPFYTYTLTRNGTPVGVFSVEEIDGKNVINGLDGGDYVLTATDSKECSISQNYALIAQEDPGFFLDDAAAICFGNDAVFEVDMTAPGVGIAIPDYEWGKITGGIFTPILTGQTIDGGVATIENDGKRLKITGLPASATEYSYQVRISGENTCNQVPLDTKIKVNPLPQLEEPIISNVSCFNGTDGSIRLVGSALAGSDNYSFSLDGSTKTGTDVVFENLPAGSYTITVINTVTNCEIILEPIVVSQPDALTLSNQTLGQPSCGEDNGSYSIDFEGGTAPFTLVLSLGGTELETISDFTGSSYSKSDLAPGTYSFTITDAKNCPITDPFTLTNDPKLPIGLVLDDLEICEGEIGVFQPVIDTGGNPRTVKWFYDALGEDLIAAGDDPSVAGVSYALDGEKLVVSGIKNGADRTYFVEISGDAYCTIIEPATIKASPPLSVTIDVPEAICFGDGVTITVNASGGEGLIEYSLDGVSFQSSNIFENTAVGTYTIAVRSQNGCEYKEIIEVLGPTAPITLENDFVIIGASCNLPNGIIQNVNVIGGWGDFIVEWRKDNAATGTVVGTTLSSVENLSPGTYFLVVTDEKGCVEIFDFTVPQQPLPDLVLVDQVICEGLDAVLTPTQTVSGASPTDLIWYKNAAGTILIQNGSDPALPQVTYTIDGDNRLLIEGLPAGLYTYYLKVVCTDELKPVNVTVNAAPNPILSKVDILCFGEQSGKIQVTENANPDFRYSINGAAPITQADLDARGFGAGTYEIVITEVGTDCSSTQEIEIEAPTAPITLEENVIIIGATCGQANGIIQNVNVIGGWGDFSFEWRKGSSTGTTVPGTISGAENLSPGLHYLIVTDEKGCEAIFEFDVPEQPFPDLVLVPLVICEGDNAEFNPTQTVSGASQTALVWYKDPAGAGLIETGPDTAMPLVNYTVDGESLLIEGLPAGIYTYYLKIVCSGEMKPVTVTVNAAPNPVLTNVDIQCFGETGKIKVTADGNPDFRYSIDNGAAFTQTELEAMNFNVGTYIVSITQLGTDCSTTQEVEILQPEVIVFTPLDTTDPACGSNDGIIKFSVSGGTPAYVIKINNELITDYNYTEVGGVYTVTGLALGSYDIVITDANGCELNAPEPFVLADGAVSVVSPNLSDTICIGDQAVLTPNLTISGGATPIINWFRNAALTEPIVDNYDASGTGTMYQIDAATGELTVYNLPVGNYTYFLEVSGPEICTVSSKADVEVTPAPNVVLDKVDVLCFGEDIGKITLVSGADPDLEYSINGATPISQAELLALELAAGTYVVDFNYVGSNCGGTQTLVIAESTEIKLDIVGSTVPACGVADGTISFSVSGGVPAYSIKINNELLSTYTSTEVGGVYTVTGLNLGSYDIVVTDTNGCVLTSPAAFVLADDAVSVVSPNLSDTICIGDQAVLTPNLTISGGVTPILNWFRDAALTEPIVDNYVAGGTGQMFGINTTTGELTVYNLPVGNFTYYLEVSGPDICTVSSKADVEVTPAPNVILEKVDVLCFGDITGKITLLSGGNPNLEYSINGAAPISQTELLALELAAGTYVVDFNYVGSTCGGTQTLVIDEPNKIELDIVGSTVPACGVADGTITFSLSGGVPTYAITINNQPLGTYSYTLNNGVYTVTGLTLGSYDIEVTDANGCRISSPAAFVLADGAVSVVSPNLSDTICIGDPAVLTPNLTVSGGVTPILNWFRDAALTEPIVDNYVAGGTGQMFGINTTTGELTVYNLPVGNFTYYLEVSGPDICTVSSKADVEVTPAPNVILEKVDVLCFGDITGKITLLSGGNPNLEYSINGAAPISQTELLALELAAGIYVVDFNYVGSTCGGTQTLVIDEPNKIELDIVGSTVPACGVADGTISFNISGGVPAYAIKINNQLLSTYNFTEVGGVYTVTGLTLGSYDIVVTDSNGCVLSSPAAFVLADGAVSVVSPNISDTICIGDQAVLTPNLTISGGATPTLKWFTTAALTEPIVDNYVAGGTGQMFGINTTTGELTVYNLPVGNYTYYLEVSGPEICTISSKADVEVTPAPNVVLGKVDILCFGDITGKITLESGADPNLEYSINGAAAISQTALQDMKFAAGTYVIDFNYVGSTCGDSQTLVIAQPDALEFELLNKVDANCGEDIGSIQFSLIGGTKGYTITINNQPISSYNPTRVGDSYTLENLAEGIYNIKILDANNCLLEESVTLVNTNLLDITATDMLDEVCEGSPAVFVPNIINQSGVNPTKRWFKDQNLTDEITSNYIAGGAGVLYQIDPTTGTLSVYNLAAGDFTFYLELTDAQICPIVAKADVKVNPFPLSQFDVLDILCFGDQTGKISLVSAGNPDLRFTVNGGAQMTLAALEAMTFPAGIYTIETVNVGAICPDVQIKEIKQPEELIFEAISFLEPSCDESNGDVVFSVKGGKSPYTILINGQPLSAFSFDVDNDRFVIGNLAPGVYDISITDANGCTLDKPKAFELTNIVATPISADKMEAQVCEGTPIEFTPVFQSGGVDPKKRWFRDVALTQEILSNFVTTGTGVMYEIDPVSGKLTVYNLSDGNYTYYLQLSDPQICTLVTTAEGIVNPGIDAQAIPTNEVCFGEANGSILVDALSGGSGVYEFSLDNANWQIGNLFENLSAGTYTVYIRDLGGQASCVLAIPNILIEGPTALISRNDDYILIPAYCDLPNGSISNVKISGGWGNFTFEWRNGSATGTVVTGTISGAENLFPDLYYLIVKDEKGCEEIFEFEIKEQDKPNFAAIVPMAICALDDITLTVIQNVPGASATGFTWSKSPSQANPILAGPDGSINGVEYEIREVLNAVHLDISGLPAGTYTYYFYAECTGQEIPISFEVVAIPEPVFGLLEISCFDADNGKIVVTSGDTSDLTYSVDGGSFISKGALETLNFGPGTYNLLAQNSQGCISLPQTLTLNQPDLLEIDLMSYKNSACGANDGFIKLSLKGGTPEYTLILTKDGGIAQTITTSAAEYTFSNLEAGVYEVALRDKNDCQVDLLGNITLLDGPTEILIDDKFIICEGEAVTLSPSINPATVNPVYTWYWNSPTTGNELSDQQQISGILFAINASGDLTISGLQTGTDYKVWVKVSGPDICEGDLKEVMIQLVPIPVFTAVAADEKCFGDGGTIQITQGPGQNNVSYSVNGGPFRSYPGNLITGLAPGNYTLASQNAGGCTFDLAQTFVILGPSAALTLSNIQAADANCGATDGTLSGQINGGTPGYQISLLDAAGNIVQGPVLSPDGNIDFNNLGSGGYSLTVTDAQGCMVAAQGILIDESPKVILANDQVICEGEVAVIRPSLVPAAGGTVFNWYYDREMTNPVTVSVTPDQFGATYQIATNGEISMSGLPSRQAPYTYYIMVDGVGSCLPEVKEVKVTVLPLPTLRVSNPSIVCDPNETVNLTQFIEGFNPNVFDYIVTSPNGNRLRLEDLARVSGTGSYTVQSSFKGSNCWTPVDRILVIISDIQLIADFQYEIVIDGQVFTDYDLQAEDQINFKDISQGNVIVWNWDFGDGTSSTLQNPTHQYDAAGTYIIRLTTIDQAGCTSVIERVLQIFNDYLIRIPNAFTPDGLTNKFFKPKFRGIVTMKLYIFNTWGDLIYETDNLEDQGWDGTLNGQFTPNGNYVYKAIFTTRTNETIERAGVFILIR